MTLRELQDGCIGLKKKNGFDISMDEGNITYEFCRMYGEIAEAFDAWRKKKNDLGEEIADIIMYAVGLGGMLGLDVESEVVKKFKKNSKRTYYRDKNGVLQKKEG
jgi:NTP pyrophosphatase (non-canonical NTP hydrolase)